MRILSAYGIFLIRTKYALFFRPGCLACLRRSVLVKRGVQRGNFLSREGFKSVSSVQPRIRTKRSTSLFSYRSEPDGPGTGAAWLNNRYENRSVRCSCTT